MKDHIGAKQKAMFCHIVQSNYLVPDMFVCIYRKIVLYFKVKPAKNVQEAIISQIDLITQFRHRRYSNGD